MRDGMELPEPYWQDEARGLRLFHGDCRDLLPCFADGEFGSVITDPLYGVGIADWDIPPDSAILAECLRVATGTVVMFGGAPRRSQDAFHALSPEWDRMLAWAPTWTMSCTGSDGMFWRWQPVYCWRPKAEGSSVFQDVLRHSQSARHRCADHPARKPPALMRDLILSFGGTSVLDPYLGSGTTLAACAKLGIPGTGIELEERYCEMAAARLSENLSYGERNLFSEVASCASPAP